MSLPPLFKSAATKSAAGDTPTEKDPAEKGVTAIPKDPNATNAAMNLPEKLTNTEVTPVVSISPSKTVGSDTKMANTLVAKAANVVDMIKNMRKSGTASEITPTLVSDAGSDNKDSAPAPSTSNAPSKKQNPDPATKDATGDTASDAKDPNAKKVEMPTPDSKGDLPKETKNTNDVTTKASMEGCMTPDSKAAGTAIDFDPSFHYKLASLILSTEKGVEFARNLIEEAHGAAEAEDIIKAASFMEYQAQQYETLEAEGQFAADKMWNNATPDERAQIVKLAAAHLLAKSTLQTEEEKQAYDAGAAAGGNMVDSGALGDPSAAGADPATAGADPSAGGADTITDDDIVAVLTELVQAGKIKPEEAEAILQALQSGGAEDQATAPAGADGSGMPPAPVAPPAVASDEEKTAYAIELEAHNIVKSASVATDAILAELAKA